MSVNKFKVLAEALAFNKLKDVNLPTPSLNARKLSIDEIKKLIREEFEDAKEVCDVKAKEVPGWHDAELEKEMNWVKTLKLSECFKNKDE
jgi:hypothetical protein